MKLHNTIAAAAALATMALTGCTNLDETVYDQVMSTTTITPRWT